MNAAHIDDRGQYDANNWLLFNMRHFLENVEVFDENERGERDRHYRYEWVIEQYNRKEHNDTRLFIVRIETINHLLKFLMSN